MMIDYINKYAQHLERMMNKHHALRSPQNLYISLNSVIAEKFKAMGLMEFGEVTNKNQVSLLPVNLLT